ncbi:ATP-grasp domain-containing protein [Hymenobacter pini]|uniref:ATP-grasp domain-containing protein n=1 Tax=Hymenobacter pini TaxID=2880879 RepID=UPI001CF234DF|nr:ATP-grasp domain-containing protein [Hymenobacter pini]MCA8833017.1 ATP-grasp domain-containing protein [Hymenobacter pini]
MHLIYPSLPYEVRTVDPLWEPECAWVQEQGWAVSLYDSEAQRLWPVTPTAGPALYRGWMLSAEEYELLTTRVALRVSTASYLSSHQASGWYDAIYSFTFSSTFGTAATMPDFSAGQRYFVKGLVKSFGTDSVVASQEQWEQLCRAHELLPTEPLFIRQFTPLQAGSERRFFVVDGVACGAAATSLPDELRPVLDLLRPRLFYSLDVAYTAAGRPAVVEVGDGQVSDLKEWSIADFGYTVLGTLARAIQS